MQNSKAPSLKEARSDASLHDSTNESMRVSFTKLCFPCLLVPPLTPSRCLLPYPTPITTLTNTLPAPILPRDCRFPLPYQVSYLHPLNLSSSLLNISTLHSTPETGQLTLLLIPLVPALPFATFSPALFADLLATLSHPSPDQP